MLKQKSRLGVLGRAVSLVTLILLNSKVSFSSTSEDLINNLRSDNSVIQTESLLKLDLFPDQDRFRIFSEISTAADQSTIIRGYCLRRLRQFLHAYTRGVDLGYYEAFLGISEENIGQIETATERNLRHADPEIRKQATMTQLELARVKGQFRIALERHLRSDDAAIRGGAILSLNPEERNRNSVTFSSATREVWERAISEPEVQKVIVQELLPYFLSPEIHHIVYGLRVGWRYYADFIPFPLEVATSLMQSPLHGVSEAVRARNTLVETNERTLCGLLIRALTQNEREQMSAMVRVGELSPLFQMKFYLAAARSPRPEIRLMSTISLSPMLIHKPDSSLEGLERRMVASGWILSELLSDADVNVVRLAASKVAGVLISSRIQDGRAIEILRHLLTHSDASVRASGALAFQRFALDAENSDEVVGAVDEIQQAALRDSNVQKAIVGQIDEALPLGQMTGQFQNSDINLIRSFTLADFGTELTIQYPRHEVPAVRPETNLLHDVSQQAATLANRPSIRLANLRELQAGGLEFSDAISLIRLENADTGSDSDLPSDYDSDLDEAEPMPAPPRTPTLPPIPESKVGLRTKVVPLDKETEKLHLEAKNFLKGRLDRKIISSNLFDLSTDYQSANAIVNLAKLQPHPHSSYRVNYSYLAEDPYLAKHSSDISQLYPNPIEDQEWEEMKRILSRSPAVKEDMARQLVVALSPADTSEIDSAREKETKQLTRKRIRRLMDHAETHPNHPGKLGEHNTLLDDVAFFLSGSAEWDDRTQTYYPRCIDGLQDTVAEYEATVFSEGNPENAADFLSRVFTDYKMNFIKRYGDLNPESSEFKTTAVQILRQRMLYSLGLRGSEAEVAYPDLGDPRDPALQPWEVMSRFLAGGKVKLQHRGDTVEFEAYTVDKMISLLNEARNRGLVDPTGKKSLRCEAGIRLTSQALDKMTLHDPFLREAYENFFVDMDETSDYFEMAPAGEYPTNIRIKAAFWLYLLEKHGYILRASQGKKRQRVESGTSPKAKLRLPRAQISTPPR